MAETEPASPKATGTVDVSRYLSPVDQGDSAVGSHTHIITAPRLPGLMHYVTIQPRMTLFRLRRQARTAVGPPCNRVLPVTKKAGTALRTKANQNCYVLFLVSRPSRIR
jgi:hypothetical protein